MPRALPAHPYATDVRELSKLLRDTPPEDVLGALSVAERLAQRLADLRWPAALAALHRGATLATVAAALDEDVEWVTVALSAWADQQLHNRRSAPPRSGPGAA